MSQADRAGRPAEVRGLVADPWIGWVRAGKDWRAACSGPTAKACCELLLSLVGAGVVSAVHPAGFNPASLARPGAGGLAGAPPRGRVRVVRVYRGEST